jgi:hypothetical protein
MAATPALKTTPRTRWIEGEMGFVSKGFGAIAVKGAGFRIGTLREGAGIVFVVAATIA